MHIKDPKNNHQHQPNFLGGKSKIRQYWNELYHSTHLRMSQGACYVMQLITRAHKDNWRRKEHKK